MSAASLLSIRSLLCHSMWAKALWENLRVAQGMARVTSSIRVHFVPWLIRMCDKKCIFISAWHRLVLSTVQCKVNFCPKPEHQSVGICTCLRLLSFCVTCKQTSEAKQGYQACWKTGLGCNTWHLHNDNFGSPGPGKSLHFLFYELGLMQTRSGVLNSFTVSFASLEVTCWIWTLVLCKNMLFKGFFLWQNRFRSACPEVFVRRFCFYVSIFHRVESESS